MPDHRRWSAVALLCAVGSVAAVLARPGALPVSGQRVAALPSPAAANSAQPQLSVSDRGVLMSWIEREGRTATLRFAERSGTGWTPPRTVASGDDWFVNWADVPSVIRLDDGTLVGHWLQKSGPGTYAYDVRLSYSTDDGRTWAESFTPHHDGTQTEHGFASLFQMPGAGLGLVWLDGRQMNPGVEGARAGDLGAMTLRFASFDREWTQTAESAIDVRVCECCPTTAAVTSDGPITAYRDRSENEIRDIYVSRLENGAWSDGRPVHADDWQINACPVNGPMLSARGRDVAIAWFNAKSGDGHVFLAFSDDAGQTFGAPVPVDAEAASGRVDVELLSDGTALVSWIEYANRQADFRVRRFDRTGAQSETVIVAPLAASRASGYPRMALDGEEVVFAWADAAEGRVFTATVGLPALDR